MKHSRADNCGRLRGNASTQSDGHIELKKFNQGWMVRGENAHSGDTEMVPELRDVGKLMAVEKTCSDTS